VRERRRARPDLAEHAGFDAHAPLQVPHAAHRPSAPRGVQHAAAL